jgi:hypothetical protein
MFPLPISTWIMVGLSALALAGFGYGKYQHNQYVEFKAEVIAAGKAKEANNVAVKKQSDLISKGIKYDPAKEGQLINAIGDVMVNELGMDKKLVRNIIYRDDDFLADTLSELHHMSKDVDEGLGKMRGNPGAYDADVRASQSGMGRGPDHRGLGQELAHETNNYAVAIDGRTWKVFADQRQAQNIAKSLQAKGKKATVHPTGANPTESMEQDAYMMELASKVAEKLNPSDPTDVWVQDFQKADPKKYHQFKNKTPQKKAQMAVAAHYAANEPSKKN